ncbi:hypothetical protein PIB30_092717, partial [Stylosanthes scabra]|nr:hypothetical protein [Stylosanthes scabra]
LLKPPSSPHHSPRHRHHHSTSPPSPPFTSPPSKLLVVTTSHGQPSTQLILPRSPTLSACVVEPIVIHLSHGRRFGKKEEGFCPWSFSPSPPPRRRCSSPPRRLSSTQV